MPGVGLERDFTPLVALGRNLRGYLAAFCDRQMAPSAAERGPGRICSLVAIPETAALFAPLPVARAKRHCRFAGLVPLRSRAALPPPPRERGKADPSRSQLACRPCIPKPLTVVRVTPIFDFGIPNRDPKGLHHRLRPLPTQGWDRNSCRRTGPAAAVSRPAHPKKTSRRHSHPADSY